MSALTVVTPPSARDKGAPDTYEAEVPDAPAWATSAESYTDGRIDMPEMPGDSRKFVRVIDEFVWDPDACVGLLEQRGNYFDGQWAGVSVKGDQISTGFNDAPAYEVGPYINVECDSDGIYIPDPGTARRLARALLDAANELERIAGGER